MFATSKDWWTTIGGMDDGLEIWGGENIEVSLRTWLCGGDIVVARGAVVFHAYRNAFPYHVNTTVVLRNLARVAEAWIDDDESRAAYYAAQKLTPAWTDVGNLDAIRSLQRRLHCKPFRWFVEKFKGRVFVDRLPEMKTPVPAPSPKRVADVPHSTPAPVLIPHSSRVPRAKTLGTIPPLPGSTIHFLPNPEGSLPAPSSAAPFSLVVGT